MATHHEMKLKFPVQVVAKPAPLMPRRRDRLQQRKKELSMQEPGTNPSTPKLSRVIHWKSEDGKHCVVLGPFPDGLYRGDAVKSLKKASGTHPGDMYVHESTTRDDRYAKVLTKDIIEILAGENEFGEISP